mgnify:CR=1 FL=1
MDMIRKLRVRFVSIMMLIICTMLIIIFGLVVHMTHSRIREDGFRMMENAVYAPMGTLSDRNPKRKDENKNMNILLPFFRVLIDADGKIVDMDGDYYDLTHEGDYYRLTERDNTSFTAWEFVAKNKERALVEVVKKDAWGNPLPVHVTIKGLEDNSMYVCSLNGIKRSGKTWNHAGITLPKFLSAGESMKFTFTKA